MFQPDEFLLNTEINRREYSSWSIIETLKVDISICSIKTDIANIYERFWCLILQTHIYHLLKHWPPEIFFYISGAFSNIRPPNWWVVTDSIQWIYEQYFAWRHACIFFLSRCLSNLFLGYLNSTEIEWKPKLEYYCGIVGRLVDSILFLYMVILKFILVLYILRWK